MQNMEDNNESLISSLFERIEEFSKTSWELFKLKALDITSDVASSLISRLAAIIVGILFLTMLTLGIALWLGELLGKYSYGFFVVAAFYAIIWAVLHFFMQKWLKKLVFNIIIKQVFNK
jgi:hypothetical protein